MATKNKWNIGDKINGLRVREQFTRFQQIVWLEYMGVSSGRIPKNFDDGIQAMQELIASQPDRAQAGFEAIVLHKVPTSVAKDTLKDVENAFYAMAGRLEEKVTGEKISEALKVAVSAASKTLEAYGKQAIKDAAENYRPLVIVQGKSRKVVKGTLPKQFEKMVQLGSQRVPMFLAGPAGCGKTYLAAKLAEALDARAYADQSCSEGVDESTFVGKLLPIGDKGKFEHVPSPFIDIYENGGVFLFDEIDAADPNLLVFLNKAIANDCIFVPQRFQAPKVVKHPDFVVVAAANTYGNGSDVMYVGRNQLDAATMDRFRAGMITMDYSETVEKSLVSEDVYDWCIAVRAAIYSHNLRRVMSTRTMINLEKMATGCQWGPREFAESYFADWSADEKKLVQFGKDINLASLVKPDAGNSTATKKASW